MRTGPPELVELLDRADAERDAGRGADAARLYDAAEQAAARAGDHEARLRAVLGMAGVHVFGTDPGRVPAVLHDVLVATAEPGPRSSVAAALARCWVYAGEAARAVPFSDEAVALAREAGDPAVLADALDAALATRWGPDELDVRRVLAEELAETAAHVTDPAARLQAHLWGLHVALELLDVHAVHRQIRALERLGDESPRGLFFAATRRAMLDLLRARPDNVARLVRMAERAEEPAGLTDGWMVRAVLQAYAAIQLGDLDLVAATAAAAQAFAVGEGSTAVHAEASYLWIAAGRREEAAALLSTFHGGVLERLPRDVDWLLVVQLVLEVALDVEDDELVAEALELLLPYAGRAVVNAGAVSFHGTTDDPLSRALARRGRTEEAAVLHARAVGTYTRLGAQWWRDRLLAKAPAPVVATPSRTASLHPTDGSLWLVGEAAAATPALRGYTYLRELLRHPGRAVPVLDLVGTGGAVVAESGLGETVDRRALQAYRDRLADLEVEIAEAEDWSDPGRLSAARGERDALLEEIGRATGLGGRARTAGSSQERARVAVRKAIATAITRIGELDPALGLHLRNSVRTGLLCSYEPEPASAPAWALD